MAKNKRDTRKIPDADKQAVIDQVEQYVKENDVSLRQAERDLKLRPNLYFQYKNSMKRTKGAKKADVVFYKPKKRRNSVSERIPEPPKEQMTLVMGTPDQIRELLKGR